MKRLILAVIIASAFLSLASAQQYGELELSRSADFERIILTNSDTIDISAFSSRINDDPASYLIILDFTTKGRAQKIVLPYPVLLEAIDAVEKMAQDKPFTLGQAEKVYKYKEFSIGWMQLHGKLDWQITIGNDQPMFIHAASFDELNNVLLNIKKNIFDFMWDEL